VLDLKYVRENVATLQERLGARGITVDLAPFQALETERRTLILEVEELRARRNAESREIAARRKRGEDAGAAIEEMRAVGDRIQEIEGRMRANEEALVEQLRNLPNLPHASVPRGTCEEENREVRRWGEPAVLPFEPKAHWDLGEALGILDFERAAKITGARFCVSFGLGARLERALISFMLDLHTGEHGYREVLPPFLVNRESMIGTGQLPKFEAELFRTEGAGYYLIPTAEVPVTNIHRGEILEAGQLPVRYAAWTPCFRREAGSYGNDTRGLIRQHQFNKVELVKFVEPGRSYDELESLTRDAATVLERLGLPYRVMALCGGDLGFSSAKTYDLEVWMPAQGKYREISSCSNFEDFQARRADIRYRPSPKARPEFVHTLNGSGLAVGRTVAAILENGQRADGSVVLPPALAPYLGGTGVIAPGQGPGRGGVVRTATDGV
jgi:seryl-tRNA synthetase